MSPDRSFRALRPSKGARFVLDDNGCSCGFNSFAGSVTVRGNGDTIGLRYSRRAVVERTLGLGTRHSRLFGRTLRCRPESLNLASPDRLIAPIHTPWRGMGGEREWLEGVLHRSALVSAP